jgi:transcriptional regulator of nitric oxide reductase
LKKLAGVILLVCGGAVVLAAQAQRIFTNPKPEGELKRLFPSAAGFSPLAGNPLHYNVYATDPQAHPDAPLIGVAFWTTDLVPNEHGYHGPIHILVGMDMTSTLTGVVVDWDSEPYGYFSVDPDKFAVQFKGKSIREPFRVGSDVDAVSRASLSVGSAARAIRDSSRLVAKVLLPTDKSQ